MFAPTSAFAFLIETLIRLLVLAMLLRLLLEAARADYFNPLVQLLVKVTDPVIRPLSLVLPRSSHFNWAGLLALFVVQYVGLLILVLIAGRSPDLLGLAVVAVRQLLRLLLMTYMIAIILSVILSWLGQGFRHSVVPLIYRLSEPVLAPIRRQLPSMGGLDLSPLVAIIAIQFLMVFLRL